MMTSRKTPLLVALSLIALLLSAVPLPQHPPLWGAPAWAQTDGPSIEVQSRLDALREDIQKNNRSFVVGYNPAMDYPLEQLCGLVEPPDWRERAQFKRLQVQTALPASFDWRRLNGVTPVKNQGGCGSCWAFGTVGVLESQIQIRLGITENVAEQYLVSCNQSGWSCGGGWWAHDYHEWRVPSGETAAGGVLEGAFPYQASNVPCNPPHPHPYRIDSWSFVDTSSPNGVPTVAEIKQAIYTHGPIGVALAVGSAFQAYRSGVFDQDESSVGINHAVVLVGWDDNYSWNGNTYGVWILRNSWGSAWGVGGYMFIKYGTSLVGYSANYAEVLPSNVTPSQGTIGTEVSIAGYGFGDTKPKVYLEFRDLASGQTRSKGFQVVQWSNQSILTLWKSKIAPGTYDLKVQPSAPHGALPIPIGQFSITNPSIGGVVPPTDSPGTSVTVDGSFFATGKPTVQLQNQLTMKAKKCPVQSSSMDPYTGASSLVFQVPKLPAGTYTLILKNGVGQATSTFTVQ